ncbi:MAG TPA: glycosyltransferase family 2 protein [Polyangiales bacterium]|nr:glycosyltransferase family 2 protein [Polyangiales bacterium]
MSTGAPSLSVIVFAYNEAENIAPVLGELHDWLRANEPEAELVFVDDGSRDDTLESARAALSSARAKFLRHETNRGIGAALKTAVRACEAPWVTFLPADGQIAPHAIATLRAAASGGDVDVVMSTYAARDDGLHRKLLSFGVRALIFCVHGVRMRSDGPYLFRRELFVPEQLRPDTFFLNFEFPIRVLAAHRRTRNVVIECRPRRAGSSKSTGWKRIAGVGKDLLDLRLRRTREGW